MFAPYLQGERTPHADPDVRGAFTGLSLRHDRGALWRAMLEGVAFGLRDSLELLRSLGATAHGASCGCASSRPCSASRSSGWSPTKAPPTARHSSQACARASSPTRTK